MPNKSVDNSSQVYNLMFECIKLCYLFTFVLFFVSGFLVNGLDIVMIFENVIPLNVSVLV